MSTESTSRLVSEYPEVFQLPPDALPTTSEQHHANLGLANQIMGAAARAFNNYGLYIQPTFYARLFGDPDAVADEYGNAALWWIPEKLEPITRASLKDIKNLQPGRIGYWEANYSMVVAKKYAPTKALRDFLSDFLISMDLSVFVTEKI